MSILYYVLKIADKIAPARKTYAHCDIPCGIYDPHLAQLSAHTVIRMVHLISDLPPVTPASTPAQLQEYHNKYTRYAQVKEQHAELCKHEIRILWGDYFKPEHAQKFPQLHDLVWKAMKAASKAKQEVNMQAAEDLLKAVEEIAEIFWKTKNVETVRTKSFYPTEREIVYPKVK
ncbi:MAG: superoxide dismutase, Ni [Thaumarchaeota archaeon]|nr:superoxide dismutase, Ni [Nitrososphaerota archaeon]